MKTVRASVHAILAALAVGAVLLLTAGPAAAHAQLISSDPKNGETLAAAPATAVLEFSERIDAPSTQIAVSNVELGVVPTQQFTVDGTKLTVPLSLPKAGLYTVGYRIVSEDGHRVDGKIAFTVRAATPGSSVAPPTSTGAAPKGSDAAQADTPKSNAAIYWILGGLVLVVLVVVIVLVVRRKPTTRP